MLALNFEMYTSCIDCIDCIDCIEMSKISLAGAWAAGIVKNQIAQPLQSGADRSVSWCSCTFDSGAVWQSLRGKIWG